MKKRVTMRDERVNKLMAAQVAKLWRAVRVQDKLIERLERRVETLTVLMDNH